jgi:Zn finger protein HypA/HybF involved in hydrogenase expression
LPVLGDQGGETKTDLQPALEAVADREAVADLRREAVNAWVDATACARCGTTIDLSMLDEPACPDCGATVHEIGANTLVWNPFASPLTTAPARFDAE